VCGSFLVQQGFAEIFGIQVFNHLPLHAVKLHAILILQIFCRIAAVGCQGEFPVTDGEGDTVFERATADTIAIEPEYKERANRNGLTTG
jgi:hypothetical protein